MSDQDPNKPPQTPSSAEPATHPGSVGLGIFLALVIVVMSLLVVPIILFQFHLTLTGMILGLLTAWVVAISAAAITAGHWGYRLTATGLWIGCALLAGILLLICAICGSMKF